MKKLSSMFVAVVLVLTVVHETGAQRPPDQPKPPPPPAAPPPDQPAPRVAIEAPFPAAQPVNIRFDITAIDEGASQPLRKTMSLTLADQQSGSLRAAVQVPGVGEFPLNVDVTPVVQKNGKIRARITLDYRPGTGGDGKLLTGTSSMRLAFGILLDNGQKVVAAQAADPMTDRRVSVEVTATVLK
jgi:hypothetical protein